MKYERAMYLANLISIMASMDSAARLVSHTIADEYQREYDLLKEDIKKEQENEARTRNEQSGGSEARADLSRGESGWSGPDRYRSGES